MQVKKESSSPSTRQNIVELIVEELDILLMYKGKLTESERSLLQSLLSRKNIHRYIIVEPCNEGRTLPGSTYPDEIESISGYVVTEKSVYSFWLDWKNGAYTLGEEDGRWTELTDTELGADLDDVYEARLTLDK